MRVPAAGTNAPPGDGLDDTRAGVGAWRQPTPPSAQREGECRRKAASYTATVGVITRSSDRVAGRVRAARWPDFFIVGAPRCATTFLYETLRTHPRVFMPERKEPRFFCRDLDSGSAADSLRFMRDPEQYLALFAGARPDQIVGEATPVYLYSRVAAAAILAVAPAARIVVSLRDPIEQMRSYHALRYNSGREPLPFEGALAAEADRRAGHDLAEDISNRSMLQYRAVASYAEQVSRYFEAFGRAQVLVMLYEDLERDADAALAELFAFLGLEPIPIRRQPVNAARRPRSRALMGLLRTVRVPSPLRPLLPGAVRQRLRHARERAQLLNTTAPPPGVGALDNALRDRLRAEMRPDVERLSLLLGRDMIRYWWAETANIVPAPLAKWSR